ncbi:hypothetical protein Pmar_PMAR028207 [Perkinsus marinus ATCC 50983]|uniref:Uncharacterized protein n=1 Tax=Perkinsus marinus (strain ATCC 50983 / TXsc) TaxID=423536 RepID=C5LB91_PERM5|nr:hypothetical protein Pmar_PMAR028207 [Perkinsus marinus ATCC 50983]EER06019.1 hypothetical protein Pmar_PMAR028207 [Perkinsus marinus ATCC 50983]|eukprot:XP_002774203.1 hypothetical protein Pmar_PMAR028207 [Perkinsus marinus ATCC 50983]
MSRGFGGRSGERVPNYMEQMRASLRRLKTENQHLKLEVDRLTPKTTVKPSGHPGDETSHFIVEIAQLRRELIVAQEQITELQSRNAALEKELRLARHQLRKGGASGEQYSHVSSRSPGGIAANRRSCPGGPVALVLREPEGRIRAGAAEKIVWTRVNGRMVPVMKDESMEPVY